MKYSIAIDLGASSVKVAAACLENACVHLVDCYTFANKPLRLGNSLYWDIFDIYKNILHGFSYLGAQYGSPESIGFDTWGATYGFLDAKGRLAEPIYHYRDERTTGILQKLYSAVPKQEIFDLTGCQCAESYTLAQLYASVLQTDPILSYAKHLVLLPDLLAYFMGGELSTERTIAGTSAMVIASQQKWCYGLLDTLQIPSQFLLPLSDTGITKGRLKPALAEETGIGFPVIISAIGHDSAAAVEAIPNFDENSLYISLGTNISMGICQSGPGLTKSFYEAGFKNTGSYNGDIIIYRDFPGAWILNNLYLEWNNKNSRLSYDDIDTMASQVQGSVVFNIENKSIQQPNARMSEVIVQLMEEAGSKSISRNMILASTINSIAIKIRYYYYKFTAIREKKIDSIWLISGAIRYKSLRSRISEAIGRTIYVGLPYASLTGNALSQFYSLGGLNRLEYKASQNAYTQFERIDPVISRDWQSDMEKLFKLDML